MKLKVAKVSFPKVEVNTNPTNAKSSRCRHSITKEDPFSALPRALQYLRQSEAISPEGAYDLLSFDLHSLGLLVEKLYPETHSDPTLPILFLPLGKHLEDNGKRAALDFCRRLLAGIRNKHKSIVLRFDHWTGRFRSDDLFQILRQLNSTNEFSFSLELFGPSQQDLLKFPHDNKETALAQLREVGVRYLQTGIDLELAQQVLSFGFLPLSTWDLTSNSGISSPSRQKPQSTQLSEIKFHWKPFINHLLRIRANFTLWEDVVCWYPTLTNSPLLAKKINIYTPEQGLRSIALAKLLLPRIKIIPPLEGLGSHFAGICEHFGAATLGFQALDTGTAERLYLPRFREPFSRQKYSTI